MPSALQFPVPLRLPGSVKARSGLKSGAPRDHQPLVSKEWHLWELCCQPCILELPRGESLPGMAPTELPSSPDYSNWPGRAPPVQPARGLTSYSLPEAALPFPLFSALLRALSSLGEPPGGEGHVLAVSGVGGGRDMGLTNTVTPSESSIPHNLVGTCFVPGTKPGVGDTKINKK